MILWSRATKKWSTKDKVQIATRNITGETCWGQVSVRFPRELKAKTNSSSSWFSVLSLAVSQSLQKQLLFLLQLLFFHPFFYLLHLSLFLNCPSPYHFNHFIGINCIFQVSCWQVQRIWFCCWDNCCPYIHRSSPSLASPAAPSPLFLCWQKPILDGVSFGVMHLSHQWERVFSHTLQGPLILRFIVSVEAEVDCLLSVMYFHWCPDTVEWRDELLASIKHSFCWHGHRGKWVGERRNCVETWWEVKLAILWKSGQAECIASIFCQSPVEPLLSPPHLHLHLLPVALSQLAYLPPATLYPAPPPSCLIISSTSSSRIPFIHLMTVSFTLPHLGSRSIKGWVRPSSTLSMISSFPWIRLHVQIGIHRDSAHCWICLAVFWGANLGSQELFFE